MTPANHCPVRLIETRRFQDDRGWFMETYSGRRMAESGIDVDFVQDNHSLSRPAGTLRGIHFQTPPHSQVKLVRCLRGRILDVAVDLRAGSPTFGKWVGTELSAENAMQLYVPGGFGHGFLTLEPDCEIAYKVSDYYAPECDSGIAWDDPDIGIDWGFSGEPCLSDKDRRQPRLADFASPFEYDGAPLRALGGNSRGNV